MASKWLPLVLLAGLAGCQQGVSIPFLETELTPYQRAHIQGCQDFIDEDYSIRSRAVHLHQFGCTEISPALWRAYQAEREAAERQNSLEAQRILQEMASEDAERQ